MHDFKKLMVWQESMDLVVSAYQVLRQFPQEEIYGLSSQIRRCSVSIPSNIAENAGRDHNNDFKRFITYSIGSSNELETQFLLAKRLNYLEDKNYRILNEQILKVQRMCNKLIQSLKK